MTDDNTITGLYEVTEALEAVIAASNPEKRAALVEALDGYAECFPEDFYWALGGQSPSMLQHLFMAIDWSCRPESESKPRPAIRLVDRKPHESP